MIQVSLQAVWHVHSGERQKDFDQVLLTLLADLATSGKVTRAAAAAGISERHAHKLITQWGEFLGAPLVVMKQGVGTRLTPLGTAILDAGGNVQARFGSEFNRLAADFAGSLNAARGLLSARLTGAE